MNMFHLFLITFSMTIIFNLGTLISKKIPVDLIFLFGMIWCPITIGSGYLVGWMLS